MLGYVYWNRDRSANHETAVNSATLAGCIVGQISFGILADRLGRRKMYGYELIILAIGTVGFIMASTGYKSTVSPDHHSMAVVSWLIFWRFVSGIGIGADYPLSAIITSEFAPRQKRARLLATVFYMQALGQLCSTLVSLAVVAGFRNDKLPEEDAKVAIDRVWRWVMGAGLVPTLVAIIARFKIPESPRYTMDIPGDLNKAFIDATDFRGEEQAGHGQEMQAMVNGHHGVNEANPVASGEALHGSHLPNGHALPNTPSQAPAYPKASYRDAKNYFVSQGNWVPLFGTTVSWFMLDLGNYLQFF